MGGADHGVELRDGEQVLSPNSYPCATGGEARTAAADSLAGEPPEVAEQGVNDSLHGVEWHNGGRMFLAGLYC